jgi:acetyl esterase
MHPQAEAAVALWARGPSVTDPGFDAAGIEQMRCAAREAAAAEPREEVAEVRDVDADGVRCRWYVPSPDVEPVETSRQARRPGRGCVVFLHGGGFVLGDVDTHDAQSRRLANRTGLAVLAVDYRRPPEHRFPAAPDDVDRAVSWLRGHAAALDVDERRLMTLGDSAGGNLALVAALRNPGVFAATVLVYPFIDPSGRHYRPERDSGALTAAESAWYWQQYAAAPGDLVHPDLAPIDSPALGGLPPTLVVAAEYDLLRGEDVELARRIEQAGAAVILSTYAGMVHGFWRHPELFDAAEESLAEIADFLRRAV